MPTLLTPQHSRPALRRQRGVTLIEALVALLVMSFGMLALVGLMSNLRLSADLAKQRSEAMRVARAELARLKSFSELTRGATTLTDAVVYDEITHQTAATPVAHADTNTTYQVQRLVTSLETAMGADANGVQVRIQVKWTDRAGVQQTVNLDTVIAQVDPFFSAAVGFKPPAGLITQPSARSPVIPADATQVDKNNSVFRPSSLSATVWVFNNLTGVIVGKCSVPVGTPVSAMTTADVASCINPTVGYLLSGTVRFSNSSPANPSLPVDLAIPLGLRIVGGTYSLPRLDIHGDPVMSGGSMVLDSYTATAPATSPDCFNDSATSPPNTFVSFYCIVYPDAVTGGATPTWSGKLELTGFSTGTTAADYRVCRYSADYNGNGRPYTADLKALENEEHPAVYSKVAGSLARQNFLVVRGDLSCPTAPAVSPSTGVFADYSTVQLQP